LGSIEGYFVASQHVNWGNYLLLYFLRAENFLVYALFNWNLGPNYLLIVWNHELINPSCDFYRSFSQWASGRV
jgi:hypothetical protein